MKLCEIFKTGKHKDSKGRERTYTTDDLDKICSNFSQTNPDVPICVGHPKQTAPAYGWVNSVKRIGEGLYCDYKQVQDSFKNAVNSGLYKTRSICVDPNTMTLKHVAFLGATPPAIKGLEEFCFSEDDTYSEFSGELDYKFDCIANVLSRLRDLLIEKYDTETADNVITKYRIDDIQKVLELDDKKQALAYCEAHCESIDIKKNGREVMTDTQKTTPPAKSGDENSEFAEEITKRDTKIQELETQIAKAKEEKTQHEYSEQVDKWITEGNILPKHKEPVMNILQACGDYGDFTFSEGNNKPAIESVKEFFGSLKAIDLGKTSRDKDLSDSATSDFSEFTGEEWKAAINKEINEAAKAGGTITPREAMGRITNTKK